MNDTQTSTSPPSFRIRFHGGPLNGHTAELPGPALSYRTFGWTYEQSGRRDGDYWVFVKRPRAAWKKKVLAFIMVKTGKDPRLADRVEPIKVPHRGRNDRCYCKSGKKYKRCHGVRTSSEAR